MKMKKITLALNRERRATIAFSFSILAIFLACIVIPSESDKMRLIVIALQGTLLGSLIPIFLFSLYCTSVYFWKLLAVFSIFGFFTLFAAYLGYTNGEVPALTVLKLTLEDYVLYVKACALLVFGLSVPIRLIYKNSK